MSSDTPEEAPASALETQLLQLQTTFTQLWQKLKMPEPPVPENFVVCGTSYSGESLTSDTLANAIQSRVWFTYRSGFQLSPAQKMGRARSRSWARCFSMPSRTQPLPAC
ncbi:hypothetical protein OXX79_013233 [Metschnikowia pulcherrima]